MKRDLQINYGVLDDIIGELRTYKRALEKMDDSLNKVSTFVQTNEGKSVEAWDQNISSSKEKIANYETQINDLLSLFENYVTDTTRYISPISRNTMMRVDRNDIWANLKQIEGGITNNLFKALNKSYQQPASFFGMFDDPTDAEKEASEINRRHMERIQTSIEATRKKLERNMDELWDLYNSKVKKFENADDEYNNLAGNVKRKYTNFFEGVMDVVSSVNKAVDDFEKGIVNSIAGMVTGLLTVVKDAGVVAVSGVVPDPVEPSWLKDSADETVDAYTRAAIQFLQDPMRAVESTAQAFTDTVEQEGVMYFTGATIPALIPGSMAVKGASGVAKLGAGAARRAPKLLDSKPFSGNYYRKKVDAAKAGMAKVREKFTFGKDYALSTGGANFILRDKEFEDKASTQMFNMKDARVQSGSTGKLNSTKDIYKVSPRDIQQALEGYEQTHKFAAHFRGFEVKAQRSLSHMSDKQLIYSFKKGYSPKDGANDTIVLHHHEQKVEGPIIEMPSRYHDLGNKRQHPFGNSGGVGSGEGRLEFNKWRKEYWKARYANEMIKRGLIE
ncbi:HNH/ENDO VII family nuclease [Virgibacillus sp. Bac330]|uniref:HNH/ENDO VII family nuclease n=1 Tax=Virgibacillus sp. Bac330 TaxID=2419841 RepID=UPI000EF47E73|nr:HNH/ENDO VII family nuclease [Virgibacillus sp. Bac330]